MYVRAHPPVHFRRQLVAFVASHCMARCQPQEFGWAISAVGVISGNSGEANPGLLCFWIRLTTIFRIRIEEKTKSIGDE